jgi:hypothetical protein
MLIVKIASFETDIEPACVATWTSPHSAAVIMAYFRDDISLPKMAAGYNQHVLQRVCAALVWLGRPIDESWKPARTGVRKVSLQDSHILGNRLGEPLIYAGHRA